MTDKTAGVDHLVTIISKTVAFDSVRRSCAVSSRKSRRGMADLIAQFTPKKHVITSKHASNYGVERISFANGSSSLAAISRAIGITPNFRAHAMLGKDAWSIIS